MEASGQSLVGPSQLLAASGQPIPAFREPSGGSTQRILVPREPIVTLREQYLVAILREQLAGAATKLSVQAAHSSVKAMLSSSCSAWSRSRRRRGRRPHDMLGVASNSQTTDGTVRSTLGIMLQHLSALPVHMLRQVRKMIPLGPFLAFFVPLGLF